jgi:hypothetical protein
VVQFRAIAERHRSGLVDDVVASFGRGEDGVSGDLWRCPVEVALGLHRWTASSRVRTHLVVGEHEAVDLGLELDDGLCRRLFSRPLLQRLVVAPDLALRLGAVSAGERNELGELLRWRVIPDQPRCRSHRCRSTTRLADRRSPRFHRTAAPRRQLRSHSQPQSTASLVSSRR